MEQGFIDILQKLIAEQGKETLLNASKCKAFLADYTRNEYKKESRLLLQALEAGVQKAIDTTEELEIVKKQQIRVLREEHFVAEEAAEDIIDTLALILRGQKPEPPKNNCKNCGNEIQKEWKACPYCGTPVESQVPVTKPVNSLGCEMVHVPGGSFQMGDTVGFGRDNERPVHTVTLSSFSIGKYEVTQTLYESVMGNNPSRYRGGNLPVETVTWYDAVEFCNKLSEKEGLQPVYTISGRIPATGYPIANATVTVDWSKNGYRLPTEAEWEYAAKGGNGSPGNYEYAGSNDVNSIAWYSDNSGKTSHAVGTKAPNGLGIYDMSGNVWEWCWDWYGKYSSGAQTNPTGASSGFDRVDRGGSWVNAAQIVCSALRSYDIPSNRDYDVGFRILRPAQY